MELDIIRMDKYLEQCTTSDLLVSLLKHVHQYAIRVGKFICHFALNNTVFILSTSLEFKKIATTFMNINKAFNNTDPYVR